MKIRERLNKIRAGLKEMFSHSIYEVAEFNGLAIEYWEDMPAHFDGRLDTTNDKPRFIAVNADLPPEDQIYVIAREIGRYAHQRQINSPFLSRPSQWDLLATAPTETKEYILKVDLEVRAYWIMFWHAGKNEVFFGFYKRHPKKKSLASYSLIISDYIFWKIRIANFFAAVRSAIRPIIANSFSK